jgi:poly(A) polymerase
MQIASKTERMPVENLPTPSIIPRSHHPISRKNIDREALKVLYRLRDSGHVAYMVGGGVRDLYLGKKPKDFDISTDARPGKLRKIFKNSRLIGRRFRLVQVFFGGGKIIEVSTFRRRSEYDINGSVNDDKEAVLAANNTYGTPSDDAFRRDLTINALFYEIQNYNIIDYVGGVKDLEEGIIRLIGEPERRITRDPARMMRVIRHAARNNFSIDPATWQAIVEHRQKLNLCPISRIRDELMKDLRSGACRPWTELSLDSGLFDILFPFYAPALESPQGGENRKLLLNIQASVDRLLKQGVLLPEQILLSLLLIPWALFEYGLLQKSCKGPEFHRLTRQVRGGLDEILGPMSIKKSHKESIALQLVTLSQFNQFAKQNKWPKWLKRKSYYKDCDLFFRIFCEARDNRPVPQKILTEAKNRFIAKLKKPAKKRRYKKKTSHGPAFSRKMQGGVFGLKK